MNWLMVVLIVLTCVALVGQLNIELRARDLMLRFERLESTFKQLEHKLDRLGAA